MNLADGFNLVSKIGYERDKIKKANVRYENAEDSILAINKQCIINQKWEEIKVIEQEIIECSRAKARDYYQELIDNKNNFQESDWILILDYLGLTLADVDYIEHVKDNLHDPELLQKAIEATLNELTKKEYKLKVAQNKNDRDRIIILNAEVKYYISDLEKHPLGIKALKEYRQKLILKRSI